MASIPGYPDYSRLSSQSGYPIQIIQQAITVSTDFPCGAMQYWPYINLTCVIVGASDYYKINLTWFQDPLYAVPLFTEYLVVGPNSESLIQIPVGGPFLKVTIQPKAGGSGTILYITMYGTLGPTTSFDLAQLSVPFITDYSAYAANQPKTFTIPRTYYGKAVLNITTSAATLGYANLNYYDFGAGGWVNYFSVNNTVVIPSVIPNIFMPSAPTQILVVNSATAQSIFMALCPVP